MEGVEDRFDRLIRERRRRVEENPDDLDARLALANTCSSLGLEEQAIAEYEAVLQRAPDHAEARCMLAAALQNLGRRYLNDSLSHYRRAIDVDPRLRKTHFNYLHALSLVGRLHEGIDKYKRLLKEDPLDPSNHLYLGFAYTLAADYERAEMMLREGLKLAPEDPYLLNALGDVLIRFERHDEAIAAWKKALAFEHDLLDSRYALAEAFELQGDISAALDQWEWIVQYLQDKPGAEMALVEAEEKLKTFKEGRS